MLFQWLQLLPRICKHRCPRRREGTGFGFDYVIGGFRFSCSKDGTAPGALSVTEMLWFFAPPPFRAAASPQTASAPCLRHETQLRFWKPFLFQPPLPGTPLPSAPHL